MRVTRGDEDALGRGETIGAQLIGAGPRRQSRRLEHETTAKPGWGRLGYRPPLDVPEPEQLVLLEFVLNQRVAVITLNRPHADNAITTELAVQFIEALETIAARPQCGSRSSPRPGTARSPSVVTSTSASR